MVSVCLSFVACLHVPPDLSVLSVLPNFFVCVLPIFFLLLHSCLFKLAYAACLIKFTYVVNSECIIKWHYRDVADICLYLRYLLNRGLIVLQIFAG